MKSRPDKQPSSIVSRREVLFPETSWPTVFGAGSADPECVSNALGQLCEIYRQPIYCWLKAAGYDHHRAEDATQDLMHRLLTRQRLKNLSPKGGRFRTYLLASLRNMLNDQRDAHRAAKRGGGVEVWHDAHIEVPVEDSSSERVLDREFAKTAQRRAMEAVRAEWKRRKRLEQLEKLEHFILLTPEAGAYAQIGPQIGLTASQVKRAVFDLRDHFLVAFREEVARTVVPEDLEGELKHLLSSLHTLT